MLNDYHGDDYANFLNGIANRVQSASNSEIHSLSQRVAFLEDALIRINAKLDALLQLGKD